MKQRITLIIWAVMALNASAYTERNLITSRADREQLKEMLVKDRKWVRLPPYSDRAAWNSILGDSRQYYMERGEKALDHDWPRIKATDYLEYERSGDRTVMERPHGANNNAVADLLLAELAEGKGRFIDQLINGVYAAAEMTAWSLSAHIPAVHQGRSLQPYGQHVIDLVAGDMGSLYSWVYYFMKPEFDKVNPEISRRLRHELKTRILDPYLDYDGWWWDGSRSYDGRLLNNWTPWCLSNILMTAMLMEDDPDRYADIVYYTMSGVDKYLNYIKGDGACEEGPSYWGHAAGKTLDYVEMLKLATGGKLDLTDEKLIRDMGEYIARSYVGDGWVVNFADASARGGGDPYLLYRYGKAVVSDLLKGFAVLMLDGDAHPQNGRDIYRTLASFEVMSELQGYEGNFRRLDYTWYPETEFCYISTPELFFAAKGGFNDESHNHNDVGTFSLWAGNCPIFIDAGVGTYTRQTFGKERYSIWTMQSGWHNLPVINGFEQSHGRRFKAADVKAGQDSFELELAGAYPPEAGIVSWKRSYRVKGREVRVTDRFDLKAADVPNVINFLTWGDVDLSAPGEVRINADGRKATLRYDPSRLQAGVTERQLPDARLSKVWGPAIRRISLTDRKPREKGTYTFTVRTEE